MPPFSKQCLLEASNYSLTFYKTRQLATWLQVSLKRQVQTRFQAYSKKKWDLFCLLKFQLSLLQLLLIGSVTIKWQSKWKWSCSVVSDSLQPHGLTVAYQAPPSMGFSRQKCWSGLPFPPPEDFPNPGLNPGLLHCRQTLYHLSYQGSQWRDYEWNPNMSDTKFHFLPIFLPQCNIYNFVIYMNQMSLLNGFYSELFCVFLFQMLNQGRLPPQVPMLQFNKLI